MPKKSAPRKNPRRPTPTTLTTSRKKQHVDVALSRDVLFRNRTTGFEKIEFVHNALPELNLREVDPSVVFLGKRLGVPLMISCMTGGYADALAINRSLAEVCEEKGIALGVGSQRQALENSDFHKTFSVVRKSAPTIPVVGNIGASEVATLQSVDPINRLIDLIEADAFTVHLNPLQEFLQPEGNTNFRGVISGIEMLVRSLRIPVIVKEIGAGISLQVARRLTEVGVNFIDIAGAGGTSWAGVESYRTRERTQADMFWDWGIPTAEAIVQVAQLKKENESLTVIASGGITNGLECAKAIALGADLTASARPFLITLMEKKQHGLVALIEQWIVSLLGAMFLTGSRRIEDLQKVPLVKG